MSRVWSSRATMSNKLKVKLGSASISPTKYEETIETPGTSYGKRRRRSARRGASPAASDSSTGSPSAKRGRSREKRKTTPGGKTGRKRSSSSSSLSSLSSLSRSRSRSSSSSSGRADDPSEQFPTTSLDGISDEYYRHLEEDVNREKRVDKCRTSKKSISYIDHTKNRSTTYLKRSGSLILASKELEIQTHCHVALHIQPTWPRGKQYSYQSGPNVLPIKNAEYAERWAGPNMCRVCGEQTETSMWMICGHSTRNRDCSYRVHCECIGLYYQTREEAEQVPFYCYKHGKYHTNDGKVVEDAGESD